MTVTLVVVAMKLLVFVSRDVTLLLHNSALESSFNSYSLLEYVQHFIYQFLGLDFIDAFFTPY
jgi:hypothetical protein